MALTEQQVAEKFAQVAGIIDATVGSPTIVNESSQFVVATYWWGRGRLNANTARPCGEFYESMLMRSMRSLNVLTATRKAYKAALWNNKEFQKYLKNHMIGYLYSVAAHERDGFVFSPTFVQRNIQQLRDIAMRSIMAFVGENLTEIFMYHRNVLEKLKLESTYQQRLNAYMTEPAQLETIRKRAVELKIVRDEILKTIKGRLGPHKQALDAQLRYKDPLTFENMIAEWERRCRDAGCNYIAIEYPEFAAPGGYQLAINAKPRFIRKALELCQRGVLYIDGDMTINRYPAIFDLPDVDMMARGWNIDPRSSSMYAESIVVDPYNFETSGGTMFFGTTVEARLLLDRWINLSETYSQWGKADDRILSLVFNTNHLLLPMKIIQLPIEYLWLTIAYDDFLDGRFQHPQHFYIEHPECLTSEETAGGAGAAMDRTPKFYSVIENSYPRSEFLHEAVMFPTAEAARAFWPYFEYLKQAKYFEDVENSALVGQSPFKVVPFVEGFGPFQDIAASNQANIAAMLPIAGDVVITEPEGAIPRILQALLAGYTATYMPPTASEDYQYSLQKTLTAFPRLELAFVNSANQTDNTFFFQGVFNIREPAFFRPCPHLIQLLMICRELGDVGGLPYQFLSRIRTSFLKRYRQRGGNSNGNSNSNSNSNSNNRMNVEEEAQDALEFLYGKWKQGGTRKKRSKARKTARRRR